MGKRRRKKSGIFSGFRKLGDALLWVLTVLKRLTPVLSLAAFFIFAFLGVREILYADPGLTIQRIRFLPEGGVQPAGLQERLEKEWLGKNILTIPLKEVAGRIQKDPAVLSTKIVRTLPSEITVTVKKREPVAAVQLAARSSYGIVAQDGMLLDVVNEKPAFLTIEAYTAKADQLRKGTKLRIAGLEAALLFMDAYQKHPLAQNEKLNRMQLDHLGNLIITFERGTEVRLGRDPLSRLRYFNKLIPILEDGERAKITYIDLQFDQIIVKKK